MSYDVERAQELVLALMYLSVHDGQRTWKGFDSGVLDAFWEAGLISDPKSRAKSVRLIDEGLARSEAMFRKYLQPPP